MRLIIPSLDTTRSNYSVNKTSLARIYVRCGPFNSPFLVTRSFCRVLGLAPRSKDAQRLVHWKDPKHAIDSLGISPFSSHSLPVLPVASVGDLPSILEQILAKRLASAASNKTLGEINDLLDRVSESKDGEERESIFMQVKEEMSPKEQKWFVRILLKDLRIGVKEESLLQFFHPLASDALSLCCDLRRVCADVCTFLISALF